MQNMTLLRAGLLTGLAALLLSAPPAGAQAPPGEAEEAPAIRSEATSLLPDLPAPASTLDRVRRSGVLRVGVATFVPWAMTSRSGDLIGFEVDVAKKLAADLGVGLVLVRTTWASVLNDLLADRFDVSTMSLSPRRALLVNFSVPYSHAQVTLVANRKKAAGVKNAAGFDHEDVTLGVYEGSVAADVAGRSFPNATVKAFDDESALLQALLDGAVSAAVAASPAPEFLSIKAHEQLFLPLADPLATRGQAFMIQKGDVDLLSYLDTWVRYHEEDGWLAAKRKYWIHGFAWEDQL